MQNGSSARRTIVVAGGGIGGVAAAIGLSRAGFDVTVLERAQAFGEIGAGIQLGPNVFHALKTLGVADKTLENAVYIDRLDHDGRRHRRDGRRDSRRRAVPASTSGIRTRSSIAPTCTSRCTTCARAIRTSRCTPRTR